jgi:hypothetical protein
MKKVVLIFATLILLPTEVNCQWYYRKYRVNDLSQLSKELLNERLSLDKKIMGIDIGALIIGSTAIIVGSHLINKIKRILGNSQIKIGLIDFKTYNMFNDPNISPAPVLSLTIHFL